MYNLASRFSQSRRVGTAVILFTVLFSAILVNRAHAHTRVEVGPYAIVVGWLVEPPVVGERNAISVEIHEGDQPVAGAEGTLNAEILYAGRSLRANLNPTQTPGLYTADLYPTVRGQYQIRLFGTLGALDVDETIEPEEVFPAARIQFPEAQPDPREMQQQLDDLAGQLQTARTLAIAGVGVGAVGLLIALFSLLRRQRIT